MSAHCNCEAVEKSQHSHVYSVMSDRLTTLFDTYEDKLCRLPRRLSANRRRGRIFSKDANRIVVARLKGKLEVRSEK